MCVTMDVDDVMERAAHMYVAGNAKAALVEVRKAMVCRQNVLMDRYAATYACAARDLPAAKQHFVKVPVQFQSGIRQRCQQEGLELDAN